MPSFQACNYTIVGRKDGLAALAFLSQLRSALKQESGPGDAGTSRGLDDTYRGGDAMAQLIADSGLDRMGSDH
jgi:hypothetical protein